MGIWHVPLMSTIGVIFKKKLSEGEEIAFLGYKFDDLEQKLHCPIQM